MGKKSEFNSEKAQEIATAAHQGQFRRDGITPYIEHPASVVARVGDDEDAKSVAWLHDVVEDTDVSAKHLQEFGVPELLIKVVLTLTHSVDLSYEAYLARIKDNELAKKVKIADMLANLSDSPTKKQIKKYAKGLLFLLED